MALEQDFLEYVDSVGLVQNKKHPGDECASGNGLLYTGVAAVILHDRDVLDAFSPLFTSALATCEKWPGLYIRHPKCADQEAGDDYYGIGAASYYLASGAAQRVLSRGTRFPFRYCGVIPLPFYYPNENQDPAHFDSRAWLGRFPALIAHLRYSAGYHPGLFAGLIHALSIAFSPWRNEDEPILSWLMIRVAYPQSWAVRLASKWFQRRLLKKYPRGMKDVFTRYFGEAHPIAQHAKEGNT
jgi:hypothetical protein